LATDEVTTQIYVSSKVVIYLGTDFIFMALGDYFNEYYIADALFFQLIKGSAGVSQPALNKDEYLLWERLSNAYLDIMYLRWLDLKLGICTRAVDSRCHYNHSSWND
jgi:hypothetical protein